MLVMPDNMIGKPVGFTCSTFDLLHAGHILMLAECKQVCDYLIVGVQSDPTIDRPGTKNKPVQSIVERYVQLSAVKFVDEIIVYNTEKDLEDMLMFLPITVRIIGEEYKDKDFTGKQICDERGIKIWYNSRSHRFSSSELRQRTYESEMKKKVKLVDTEWDSTKKDLTK
jgi:glycerol-3-phosphate cytidylyltransferase